MKFYSNFYVFFVLEFSDLKTPFNYYNSLAYSSGDTLTLLKEYIVYRRKDKALPIVLEHELKESGLKNLINSNEVGIPKDLNKILGTLNVFQFHDTTPEAKIRNSVYINDGDSLHSDGGNLAAFLYKMRNSTNGKKYYSRIVEHVKLVLPQFNDFVLYPTAENKNNILLNWKNSASDYLFGSHQLSDGTLRFMAMASLLLQPPESLPSIIIIDEPELGLHPFSITVLASMIKMASQNCQVIVATQSAMLMNEFQAKDIVVVEWNKNDKCSIFKKLDDDSLDLWLEKYSLSEIWEKNIIGGNP